MNIAFVSACPKIQTREIGPQYMESVFQSASERWWQGQRFREGSLCLISFPEHYTSHHKSWQVWLPALIWAEIFQFGVQTVLVLTATYITNWVRNTLEQQNIYSITKEHCDSQWSFPKLPAPMMRGKSAQPTIPTPHDNKLMQVEEEPSYLWWWWYIQRIHASSSQVSKYNILVFFFLHNKIIPVLILLFKILVCNWKSTANTSSFRQFNRACQDWRWMLKLVSTKILKWLFFCWTFCRQPQKSNPAAFIA